MKAKESKAITLIALVITIIILIILAGISINLILGENGIVQRAKQAKEDIRIAQIEEEEMLNELYVQVETRGETSEKLNEFKKAIADYIEEAGGIKPEYTADTLTFGNSIKQIVKEVTKNATATADNITAGKTAYINGELITGNGADNENSKNQATREFENLTVSDVIQSSRGTYAASISKTFTEEAICGVSYHNGNGSYSVTVTKNGENLGTSGFWNFGLYANPTKLIKVKPGDTVSISVSGGEAGLYDYYIAFICNFNIIYE